MPLRTACMDCGRSGCRLYREYQTINPDVRCRACTIRDQGKGHAGVDLDSFSIGWYVAAIVHPDGDGYWGVTSVPQEDAGAWLALPI